MKPINIPMHMNRDVRHLKPLYGLSKIELGNPLSRFKIIGVI